MSQSSSHTDVPVASSGQGCGAWRGLPTTQPEAERPSLTPRLGGAGEGPAGSPGVTGELASVSGPRDDIVPFLPHQRNQEGPSPPRPAPAQAAGSSGPCSEPPPPAIKGSSSRQSAWVFLGRRAREAGFGLRQTTARDIWGSALITGSLFNLTNAITGSRGAAGPIGCGLHDLHKGRARNVWALM